VATPTPSNGQRIAIVTGGGGGIGAAIAEELGRTGVFVVTLDPMVSVDGSEQLPPAEETTADRIVAAGGSARASAASVTDRAGVQRLFAEVADEFGRLDVVVNVAGITRPTSFTAGREDDWQSVLSVHLDGYRNVLDAALPIMAAAGGGHILGVTSGSGWRAADTGAYGCAKRAVASLTWQLGRRVPQGVIINALSPIAMTRMVTSALKRQRPANPTASGSSATGGLSLMSMPAPEQLGPLAVHLVAEDFTACRGQVVFSGGSEMAVITEPRYLEFVSTASATPLGHALEAVTPGALIPAELQQESKGGSNPRFSPDLDDRAGDPLSSAEVGTCAVVIDGPQLGDAVVTALEARGITCHRIQPSGSGFDTAAADLAAIGDSLDAVVLGLAGGQTAAEAATDWERTLAEHHGIVGEIQADAGWARAVTDHSAQTGSAIRLVTLIDAGTAGGRSRAQAAAQLARAARGATDDKVSAFAVSIESADPAMLRPIGELAAHLLASPETPALSGAELAVDSGWIGLRSHPRVGASVTFGGAEVPGWIDDAFDQIVADPQKGQSR
jgi:NAD(P)-dependent dehydrogenase (short-subunit alcohol dehydrogenase family)